jgi:psiF repeat
MRNFVILGAVLTPLWAVAGLAATATPSAGTAAPKAVAAVTRTPESVECSKQADAKGLHGKPRKTFRSACKKELLMKKKS